MNETRFPFLACRWFRVQRNYPRPSCEMIAKRVSKTKTLRKGKYIIGRRNIGEKVSPTSCRILYARCTRSLIKITTRPLRKREGYRRRGKPIGRNINFEPTTGAGWKSWKVSRTCDSLSRVMIEWKSHFEENREKVISKLSLNRLRSRVSRIRTQFRSFSLFLR